jgi:acyl-CoA hydrolase
MDYSSKIITASDAVKLVKSNDEIITGLGAAEGRSFLMELHTIANLVDNVTVTNCLPMSDFPFMQQEYKDVFNIDGWFYSPALRKAHKNGNISFIPNHLHLAGVKRLAHKKPNIYVGSASSVDKHGFVSLSTSNTYEKRILEAADIAIIEVNPNFPVTYGDVEVHVKDIDYIIETNYQIPALPEPEINEKDRLIGSFIADYVNDGDCIQFGIGGIPNAVAEALMDKKDLGVHTEMLTTGLMKLAKKGVINGSKKSLHRGKMVCTFALGSQELYEFIDHNPSVLVLDGHYVNDPHVIGLNDNQISINTTLEIDLTGQCCSESIGSLQFSGTGGQSDTAVGAQKSRNGKSFIALYSTAFVKNKETGVKEEISKIVPQLKPGAAVSLSRNDVDYVVTEYGVAALKGTNVKERVERLIAIAHPKFRDSILNEAKQIGII